MAGQTGNAVSLGATPVSPSPCYSEEIDSFFTKLHNLFSSCFWPQVKVQAQSYGALLNERRYLSAPKALKYDFRIFFISRP